VPARTVGEALHEAASRLAKISDDPRLEADVLMAHAMRIDRAHLLARLHDPLDAAMPRDFEALLARRLAREPLAYIVGVREFYGIEIACGPGALIPRPESELLVDVALDAVRERGARRIADVGTGAGAIAVAIAVHARDVRVTAIEWSALALSVARRNVEAHGVAERVELREGDLVEGTGEFDVIVANLPYVSEAEWEGLAPEIREHEPREALVGGARGTEVIERLIAMAPAHIVAGGVAAVEIGDTQGEAVVAAVRGAFREGECSVMKDLAGLDRVVVVRV
jgi:release factor glutamine methyltransferase